MRLPDRSTRKCKLLDLLHVPALSYNHLSVSKAAESGAVTEFDEDGCKIHNSNYKLIAKANKLGRLYHLDCEVSEQASIVQQESKKSLWHRRYGYLGVQSLRKLYPRHLSKMVWLKEQTELLLRQCARCLLMQSFLMNSGQKPCLQRSISEIDLQRKQLTA